MTQVDRWQKAKEVFGAALERPLEARAAFLTEACGDDVELRREVESLLAAGQEAGRFLSASVVSPEPERDLTGERIGPYRILAKAGQGGMGVVYEAEDTRLGRQVALKLLPASLAHNPGARALAAGTHSITAVYSGDATHDASTSNVLTQTVQQPPIELVVQETITVTDTPAVTPSVMLTIPETITVTDEPTVSPSVMIVVPETITVTDTPTLTPSLMLTIPETITVTDTPEVTVGGSAPTVTVDQAAGQADPTSASPIQFDVTFSEPVTGFDGGDVSFMGSTVGGTLLASIGGSGASHTISVTGMDGDGLVQVQIPAGAALDLAGNVSLASLSTDNVVTFQPVRYRLTVTKTGAGTGTLTSAPGGINCGATCAAQFDGGTVVTLTAAADAGFAFGAWSGDPDCADGVVTMDADRTCTATFNRAADLRISALNPPGKTGAGMVITVNDTTKNRNNAGPAAASTTWFYLSLDDVLGAGDVELGSRSVPPLAPGVASAASTPLTIPANTAPGFYFVIAKADGDGVLQELDEGDNTRAKPIDVGPDLIVSRLNAPSSAAAGASITVRNTVRNTGGGATGASTVKLYFSDDGVLDAGDTFLGSRPVGPLAQAPGSTSPHSTVVTIPAGATPGSYFVIAVADADQVISELDETNNLATERITVN